MDDGFGKCGLCWVSCPVLILPCQLVSPGPARLCPEALPSLCWGVTGNVIGSLPGHHGMGDWMHPSEAAEHILSDKHYDMVL